jgi:Ca-activated chloride channel family protein
VLSELHFIRPEMLWSLIPALILFVLIWRRAKSGASWQQVIDPALLPYLLVSPLKTTSRAPIWALLLAWIIAALAVAGPTWERIPQPVHQRLDAMVVILDLSRSMLAEDVQPSRLVRSHHKILDLLKRRDEGVTALVAYAGDAHVVSPLTDDTGTIANLVPALAPNVMPVIGSATAEGVASALELLNSAMMDSGRLLLITDGVSASNREKINKLMSGSDYELSIIGVGTEQGSPIPMPGGKFLKDAQGDIVLPGLREAPLSRLADKWSGSYHRLSFDDSDLDVVLSQDPMALDTETTRTLRQFDQWQDQGYWLGLLLLPLLLGAFRRGWILGLTLLIALPTTDAQAMEWRDLWQTADQQGAEALAAEQPELAAELFANEEWAATANYRSGEFATAAEILAGQTSAAAAYNLGNAQAKVGDYPAAIQAYEVALELRPDMEDALYNKNLLEQLMQQQESDPSQSDQGEQDQQDEQQQSNESDSQQSQSDAEPGQGEQDPQNKQGEPSQQQDNEGSADDKNEESPDREGEQPEEQTGEQNDTEEAPQSAAELAAAAEQAEQDQATEQWLRTVPDDPAGLLRRKFKFESGQSQKNRTQDDDESW